MFFPSSSSFTTLLLDPSFSQVNRILYVRNLPYKITAEELYDLFGRYGALRQVRVGNTQETKGTAFVVYEGERCVSAAGMRQHDCGDSAMRGEARATSS